MGQTKRNKILTIILSVTMVLTMLPTMVFAAAPQSKTSKLTVNESKVVFAGGEWWVIGDENGGVYPQKDHITLLAANVSQRYISPIPPV